MVALLLPSCDILSVVVLLDIDLILVGRQAREDFADVDDRAHLYLRDSSRQLDVVERFDPEFVQNILIIGAVVQRSQVAHDFDLLLLAILQ